MADKDFVVKNGLVVGDTATINGVQVDPFGATSGQVLKFDGTKFSPAPEGDISGTVYSSTIGDGTSSSYTITHNLGTRDIVVVVTNAASPYEVINVRWEATTTSTVTLDFSAAPSSNSVRVSIYSAVAGSTITIGSIDDLGDVTITSAANYDFLRYNGSAWINDSIDLGTDTTGNYVQSLVAGTGITLTNATASEGGTPTIAVTANTYQPLDADLTAIGGLTGTSGLLKKTAADTWTLDAATYVSTADTGTVTSTMIADGTIVNADVNASAAIALSKLASGTSGQVVIANASGVPTYTTLSGDVTVSNTGVVTIAADSVALGTDTTGNYVQSLVAGTGVTLSNNSGEGATPTVSIGQSVATSSSPTFANLTVSGSLKITTALEIASVSATASTGTINIDFLSNPVVYYTSNASANWTLNIRGNSSTTMNTVMSTGDIATVTFMAQQGSTAYYANTYQIDGTTITPKWQGGTAPTSGNASSIDSYVLSIIKTAANTYTVFASQTKFA